MSFELLFLATYCGEIFAQYKFLEEKRWYRDKKNSFQMGVVLVLNTLSQSISQSLDLNNNNNTLLLFDTSFGLLSLLWSIWFCIWASEILAIHGTLSTNICMNLGIEIFWYERNIFSWSRILRPYFLVYRNKSIRINLRDVRNTIPQVLNS